MYLNRNLPLIVFCLMVLNGCTTSHDKVPSVETLQSRADTTVQTPVFVDADAGKKWNIFGLEITGKIMSEQTGGQYSVIMSTTPPDGGPPLHVHQYEDELFYVVEGKYEFRCGPDTVQASKGDLVYLPRGIPHGFRNVGAAPGVLMNTISPGGFEQFFEEIDRLPKDIPLDRQKVRTIAKRYGLRFLAGNGATDEGK